MIVKEDFLKKLRAAFDLNIYEVKIWTALLSKGVASAGELSDISNVPRSRSYDVLESLEKKGFVIMKLGKPIKYLAIKPEEIIKRVKDFIQNRATTQVENLEKVRSETIFSEIELLYKHGIEHVDASALSGAVKGRDSLHQQISSMLDKAEKSVIIVTTTEGFIRKGEKFKNALKKLAANGVKIRIAAPITADAKRAYDNLKNSAQIKNLDEIKARFIIVDNKEVLFNIADDKEVHESYDTGIWVSTPYFANAMSNMFNSIWNGLENPKV